MKRSKDQPDDGPLSGVENHGQAPLEEVDDLTKVDPATDQDIKPRETNALVVGGGDYGDYSGQGFENTTRDDFSIPFLNLLQALSKQVEGEDTLEGARSGMLFNTVTEDLFDGKTGLAFIPAYREQVHVEWIPRNDGGGFVARHELGAEIAVKAAENRNEKGVPVDVETGHEIIQTAYIYGIIVHEDGRYEPVVISFSSTKLKVYRHLMTKLNQFTTVVGEGERRRKVVPPLFAHRLRITTKVQKHPGGSSYNFVIGADGESLEHSLLPTDDEGFIAALEFRKLVRSGTATVNYDSVGEEGDGVDGKGAPF